VGLAAQSELLASVPAHPLVSGTRQLGPADHRISDKRITGVDATLLGNLSTAATTS
jgi:hypothetical protein